MDYINQLCSPILSKEIYSINLDAIINILKMCGHEQVDLLFGFSWGNDYKDWKEFKVPVQEIKNEIVLAQKKGVGEFGANDLFITIPELQTEILFCHEMDIHLRYEKRNRVVNEIVSFWHNEPLNNKP
ncbi:hypothetical protein AAU57_05390 [Nonlabens sp. YIK11]|uniref:hypothetical protein n=1 Tax=Nonlabens sp. YIK11 TaxID=1453349 RepID=UPI0006DC5B9A|nr:hypothetical protein [Nonlabens sp. YIK11]KQC32808.1 hypothetical protein AAU57_05390 [Nonlabens sp. YIK11]